MISIIRFFADLFGVPCIVMSIIMFIMLPIYQDRFYVLAPMASVLGVVGIVFSFINSRSKENE